MRVFLVICVLALAGCGSSAHDEAPPPAHHGTVLKATATDVLTPSGECSRMAQQLRREMERREPAARGGEFNTGCSEISIPLKK